MSASFIAQLVSAPCSGCGRDSRYNQSADAINRTTIHTAVVIVLTSNVRAAAAAGNVLLTKKDTGLDRDYLVANVSQLATIDREFLRNHSGRLPPSKLQAILRGVDTMLGR